jgi:hydrogenase/urease accessory protein HupE
MSLRKKLQLLFAFVCLMVAVAPAYSHSVPMGGSVWCLRENGLFAYIDLNQELLSEIKEVKDGHYDLASIPDQQLQQLSASIIQPYLNKKLSVTVNGRSIPVRVDKLTRDLNGSLFTIWLSADQVGFSRPENSLKIEYRLLFDETNKTHLNMGYLFRSDATGPALQKVLNSPAEGQHNFDSASPVWELSVKGPATVTKTTPEGAPLHQSVQGAVRNRAVTGAAPLVTPAAPAPENPSAGGVKLAVAPLAAAAQNGGSAAPAFPQNLVPAGGRGAVFAQLPSGGTPSLAASESGKTGRLWCNIGNFIMLGIEHILTGYDHIAFLIGLIVIGLTIREVLKIITAFTIAHSITLLLAAFQVISLNSRFVESVIALSICYIALENLFKKEVKYRWVITFCFGLVHGFGFASALQELIVGKSNLLVSVISFNIGVEMGQLMIFFILLPVLYLLKQRMEFRKVTTAVSVAIFIFGFTWLIERLFDLKLISS